MVFERFASFGGWYGDLSSANIWRWGKIKFSTYSIIYSLNKRIFKKIEEYDREIIKFSNFLKQKHEVFSGVIREEFQETLGVKPGIGGVFDGYRNILTSPQ